MEQMLLFDYCPSCKRYGKQFIWVHYKNTYYCDFHTRKRLLKYSKIHDSDLHYKLIREKVNQTVRNLRKTNPIYRVKSNIRKRIQGLLDNINDRSSYIGCSGKELKLYLESKFLPGMNWDNYGKFGWHVDHVKPLASFNLCIKEERQKACHFTNLQPLWWRDNLSKGDKYNE